MPAVIEQGPTVQGTATQFRIPLPAKTAGDYVQFIVLASDAPTSFTAEELVLSFPGTAYVYQRYVETTGPATTTSTGLLVKFAASTAYKAFGQVAHVAGTTNPNPPATNEALRQAILGMTTGSISGLPFNSGVNPSGRNAGAGAPDGYEYLNDVVESANERGVKFDIRAGFQYQNRSLSEGATAWNDLKGMQLLDWFDDSRPAILAMQPFPKGGTYTAAKNGTYDTQYVAIGQAIAAKRPAGKGKVGLRLAWEMNGNWYTEQNTGTEHGAFRNDWSAVPDYVAGSQRIISKIREGAGDRVFFIQCWSASPNTRYQSTYWGDAYADVISIDVYDAYAGTTNGIHTEAQLLATGLGGMFQFARDHGKLVALDEWGGHNTATEPTSGHDNPDFPVVVYNWLYTNRDVIAYEAQFNDNAVGNVQNNLWNTGVPVQLPNQRAALISKLREWVLTPPANVTTENTSGSASVTWEPVPRAEGFTVQRVSSGGAVTYTSELVPGLGKLLENHTAGDMYTVISHIGNQASNPSEAV